MMRIVRLDHDVGDRQLNLVCSQPTRFVARDEAVARSEVEQNVRALPDDELA